jgi:hypothetical protein
MEIFTQTVNAIQTFHENSNVTTHQRIKYSAREREYFKSCLTVSTPEGDFDQMDRTFELTTLPQVSYYYTLDDSIPSYTSHRYVQKVKVKQPRIKVIGIERCKYRSPIAEFDVPGGMFLDFISIYDFIESISPKGYFDPITKSFHLITKPECAYFISIDGSKPDERYIFLIKY